LFFNQIKALEQVFNINNGVDSFIADTLQVYAPTFDAFIRAALDTLETINNSPLFAMTAGCLELAIAINA
jgi:hypothetical protein